MAGSLTIEREASRANRGAHRSALTRSTRHLVGWSVLVLLFAPLTLTRFLTASGAKEFLNVGTMAIAGYLSLVYALAARARIRLFLAAVGCSAVYAIAAIPYVLGGWWRSVDPGYLVGLLQYVVYPLILGLLLPAFLSGREILRMSCVIMAAQGVVVACVAVPTFFGGHPLLALYRAHTGNDALAIQLGVLALATYIMVGRTGSAPSRGERQRRTLLLAITVVLGAVSLPAVARAATLSLAGAVVTLMLVNAFGRRLGATLTHVAILAAVVFPVLVWAGVITETNVRVVDPLIMDKRAQDATSSSTLVNRIRKDEVFLSRLSYTDFIGSRRELHDYEYYHAAGLGANIEFAHNYWVQMLLTVGYGGSLAVLVLWFYMTHLAGRCVDGAGQWALCWFVFFTINGTVGFGAFRGLPALAFWCIAGGVLASLRWSTPVLARRSEPVPATAPAQMA